MCVQGGKDKSSVFKKFAEECVHKEVRITVQHKRSLQRNVCTTAASV